MKKSLFAFVAVLIITLGVTVQAQKTYVGVFGGANFADLKINFVDNTITDYDVRSRTLFCAGGFFGINLNNYMSVQLELMFVQKGGVFTKPSMQDMRLKSNQLELPLILKAGIGERIRACIIGGVFLSFVLDATLETELGGLSLESDLTEILKNTEFVAVFGAGLSIPVWKDSSCIENSYALGLTNLNKGGTIILTDGNLLVAGSQTDPQDEIKTMGIQIMLGYQLPLGWE